MIRLTRQRASIPAQYRGEKFKAMMLDLLAGYYDFNKDIPFNREKSRFQKWQGAKLMLRRESNDKCAYCESPTAVAAHGDVEHFRPKDLYWWLAFSYDNYTYACQLCNQKFKGANFPVAAKRLLPPVRLPNARPSDATLTQLAAKLCPDPATSDDAMLRQDFRSEKGHLPHPYLDDPERLFAWKIDRVNREVRLIANGTRVAARRAVAAAEEFLGMNREELCRFRFIQYELIEGYALIVQETHHQPLLDLALTALRKAAEDDKPYAGMTRYFLKRWGLL